MTEVINEFFSTCPRSFDFPMGGNTKIPMESESKLAEMLQALPSETQSLISLRATITMRQAYQLLVFSVRMAILAARSGYLRVFNAAVYGLLVVDDLVDWRDTLGALSIIEDCANRAGIDFEGKMKDVEGLMGEKLRETVFDGYLARSFEMRTVAVMGFATMANGSDIYYVRNA